jgi:SPP1 gp7 family putative phage head morphogenesis protein
VPSYPNLTSKQQEILKKVISEFMKGGKTIGFVVDALSKEFPTEQADLIAVTEITRAYAISEQKEGEKLKREWKDVPVVKIWTTNQDFLVCPICRELDGKEVEIDEPFAKDIFLPPAHPGCRCWISVTPALARL